MKRLILCLPLLLPVAFATPATAASTAQNQTAPATPFDLRVEQLVAILNDAMPVEEYFTPSFLAAVPPAQLKAITSSLRAQYGKAIKVVAVDRKVPNSAILTVELERAIATIDITVEAAAPNKVAGLLATGFVVKGDDITKIGAEFEALPRRAGYLV